MSRVHFLGHPATPAHQNAGEGSPSQHQHLTKFRLLSAPGPKGGRKRLKKESCNILQLHLSAKTSKNGKPLTNLQHPPHSASLLDYHGRVTIPNGACLVLTHSHPSFVHSPVKAGQVRLSLSHPQAERQLVPFTAACSGFWVRLGHEELDVFFPQMFCHCSPSWVLDPADVGLSWNRGPPIDGFFVYLPDYTGLGRFNKTLIERYAHVTVELYKTYYVIFLPPPTLSAIKSTVQSIRATESIKAESSKKKFVWLVSKIYENPNHKTRFILPTRLFPNSHHGPCGTLPRGGNSIHGLGKETSNWFLENHLLFFVFFSARFWMVSGWLGNIFFKPLDFFHLACLVSVPRRASLRTLRCLGAWSRRLSATKSFSWLFVSIAFLSTSSCQKQAWRTEIQGKKLRYNYTKEKKKQLFRLFHAIPLQNKRNKKRPAVPAYCAPRFPASAFASLGLVEPCTSQKVTTMGLFWPRDQKGWVPMRILNCRFSGD